MMSRNTTSEYHTTPYKYEREIFAFVECAKSDTRDSRKKCGNRGRGGAQHSAPLEQAARECDAIFDDDASLIEIHGATLHLLQQLVRRDRIAITGNARIIWPMYSLLPEKGAWGLRTLRNPPFGIIQMGITGAILGERLNIYLHGRHSILAGRVVWVEKAGSIRSRLKRRIFNRMAIETDSGPASVDPL